MAKWKNTSKSTFERPGDGKKSPGWTAGPGDIVDADTNPVPGAFTEQDETPPQPEPAPVSAPAEETK